MLLKYILDQSGECTFKATGWKDSNIQQLIPGNDFWQHNTDMTNRCSS